MEHLCHCGKRVAAKRLVLDQGEIFLCEKPECKDRIVEQLDEDFRQFHQGRSRKSYESSAKIVTWTFSVMAIITIAYLFYSIVNNFLR